MSVAIRIEEMPAPWSVLNGTVETTNVSCFEIAHAAFFAGRFARLLSLRELIGGVGYITEICAYLENVDHPAWSGTFRRGGGIRTAAEYADLEDSERRVVSFRVGSGLAALSCAHVLEVPYVVHIGNLVDGVVQLTSGGRRPDFLGLDAQGGWHVIEAKGYVQPWPSRINRAKEQAKNVSFVAWPSSAAWPPNGPLTLAGAQTVAPKTRCVSISRLNKKPIDVRFEDPPEDENLERVVYAVEVGRLLNSYYSPIASLAEFAPFETREISGVTCKGAHLPGSALWLGLERSLLERLNQSALNPTAVAEHWERWTPIWREALGRPSPLPERAASSPLEEPGEERLTPERDVQHRPGLNRDGDEPFFESIGLDGTALAWDGPR